MEVIVACSKYIPSFAREYQGKPQKGSVDWAIGSKVKKGTPEYDV
jgi:hypothetical protein